MNWDALNFSILGPALAAGLLVLSTHVPLGKAVLKRGIIFIDLAIAQIAAVGVIAADAMGFEAGGWGVQIAAVTAAIFGAFFLNWTEKKFAKIQEPIIGICFVLSATLAILLLANDPHGGENLKDLLVGQILWISYEQLLPITILYAIVISVWFRFDIANQSRLSFYLIFAITITASVQLVGIYLVFASLIIPALATRLLESNKQLFIAYLSGFAGYLIGLIASAIFDLPSGAVIVWMLAIFGIIFSGFSGKTNKAA
jgi:zinc/manganese transport system permease protein